MLPSLAAQKGPIISRPPALSAENLQKVENWLQRLETKMPPSLEEVLCPPSKLTMWPCAKTCGQKVTLLPKSMLCGNSLDRNTKLTSSVGLLSILFETVQFLYWVPNHPETFQMWLKSNLHGEAGYTNETVQLTG
jgi:hypothetical protein